MRIDHNPPEGFTEVMRVTVYASGEHCAENVTCLNECHPVVESPDHVNLAPPEVAHLLRTLAARVTP